MTVQSPVETSENPTEEVVVPTVDMSTLTPTQREIVEETIASINAYNAKVSERKAKYGDFVTAKEEIYASADPGMVKALERIEALKAEIEKVETLRMNAAKQKFEESRSGNAEDEAALAAEIESLGKDIKVGRSWIERKNADLLTVLPKQVGKSTGTTGDGKGKGGTKLRGFEVSVNGEVAKLNGKSSFSAASSKTGVPTATLQASYFAKIGTQEVDKFPESADFSVSNNGKDYVVTARRLPKAETVSA